MTAHDFRFVELTRPNGERRPARMATVRGSDAYRVLTPTTGVTGGGKMAALSRLGRKAEALLWSTVSPLLTVAAAGLIAITLAHLPATDRPVALAGPLSGHSLLHFPR